MNRKQYALKYQRQILKKRNFETSYCGTIGSNTEKQWKFEDKGKDISKETPYDRASIIEHLS